MAFTATPGSFTPINMWAMLRMLINQNTPLLNNPGPPINGPLGTYAGQAGPGALLIDFVSTPPQLYINIGTLASPNWSKEVQSLPGVVQYLPFVNTGLFAEFFNPSIIASGSSQNTATPTTGAIILVTGGNGGIQLSPAVGGLDITVINHSGAAIQVYGNAATQDTIDDIASSIGVTVMNNSTVLFFSASPAGGGQKAWYSEGLATGFSPATGLATSSFAPNISAAGTNQFSATQLTQMMNRVSTVAPGSGVALPVATPGEYVIVNNRGLSPLLVYGNSITQDTINNFASSVGVTQAVNTMITFICFVQGNWEVSYIPDFLIPWVPLSVNGAILAASQSYIITSSLAFAGNIPVPSVNGIDITISSDSPNPHTLTFIGGTLDSGGAGVNTLTWNSFKGATARVVSYNNRWKLVFANGVSAS